jgi:hypothetical protein
MTSKVHNAPRTLLFVGECRSLTAQRQGWTWKDGRLAAKPLFEALAAMGVDASAQAFVNLWTDNATGLAPGERAAVIGWQKIASLRKHAETGIVIALGQRVSAELARRGVDHVAIVHPAARGKIRKRERYHAHVREKLGPHLRSSVAKRWFEVWYYNPRDNGRAQRVDARRRSKKTARALADELMAKGLTHKPDGAWLVEVNRLKAKP